MITWQQAVIIYVNLECVNTVLERLKSATEKQSIETHYLHYERSNIACIYLEANLTRIINLAYTYRVNTKNITDNAKAILTLVHLNEF